LIGLLVVISVVVVLVLLLISFPVDGVGLERGRGVLVHLFFVVCYWTGTTLSKPTPPTGKLISRRTNTTTTDITARSPINEQRPQEIAHVTYLTLI